MDHQLTSDDLTATVRVYQLLARCWLSEIDLPLLRQLCNAPLADAFRAVGGEPPDDSTPEVREDLAFDYCQLFLGPANHLPPYQSVWTNGQFQAEPVESITRFIELVGCPEDRWDVMPDHLGAQLDLMQLILTVPTDSEALSREIASTYFTAHLSWATPLLTAAEKRAQTGFYRSLAIVTRDFLHLQQINMGATE